LSFSYQNKHLHVESVNIIDLASAYGSPLYVYSRTHIEQSWQKFNQAFGQHPHLICYAVKANSNLAVLNVLAKLGSGFDIVSLGELERVLMAGGLPERIVFSGVGKTKIEIERALNIGIRCFNVESENELLRLESIAKKLGKCAPISIRVNPNVNAKTHPYISTGLKENKFGVDMQKAYDLYQLAHHSKHLNICGIDCHIGSQIVETSPFLDALDKVLTLIKKLKNQGIEIFHLDLGGGIGIQYSDETPPDITTYIQAILAKAGTLEIILEPGRAIVGNAGILLTQVEFLKQTTDKSFAIIDAAMNDLLRPSFYQSYHQVLPVQQQNTGINADWDLVGPICETGDFLAKNRNLSLNEGDYLAVMSAGAYGFGMSSNYNSRTRVAEVMVSDTQHQLIRKRETIVELFASESLFDPAQ
jgi:diaminopimelate decarboxylase